MYSVLKGVNVVELAAFTFVPSAAAVLADWGASVIKVEHPVTGDPQRGAFNALSAGGALNPMIEVPNRGKRSVGIDVATDEGRALLYDLVRDADVFLTSFLPETVAKLGVDVVTLKSINPRLIYARGTAYGVLGDEATRGGFDVTAFWSRGGTAYAMTPPGGAPPHEAGSPGDIAAGSNLAAGVAAALFRRERDGHVSVVDVSLYGTGMWTMSQAITGAPLGLEVPFQTPTSRNPLVNFFPTKDGRWFALCMSMARWWPDLVHHIGRPELLEDDRFDTVDDRIANAQALVDILGETFRQRTMDEWCAVFATAEGAWSPVMSPLEISGDPVALDNGFLTPLVAEGLAPTNIVASPVQFDETPIGILRRAPEPGQQTEEVLLEMGLSWDEIGELKRRGTII